MTTPTTPDPGRGRLAEDRLCAAWVREVLGRLEAGDVVIRAMWDEAHRVAPHLLAHLDPRTPPGEVGRALILVANHVAGIMTGAGHGALCADVGQAINLQAVLAVRLIDLAGDVPTVLARGQASTDEAGS